MRWIWLALALCAGCGGSVSSEPSDKSGQAEQSDNRDAADAGWVIQGTTNERLLLSNGSLGLWLKTHQGVSGETAFRMLGNEVLLSIPDLNFNGEGVMDSGERRDWSFDLRTGEFVLNRRGGNVGSEMRVMLHPSQPAVATKWTAAGNEPFGRVRGLECALPIIERDSRATVYELRSELGEAHDLRLTLASSEDRNIAGFFLNAEPRSLPKSYDDVLAVSKKFHQEFWKTDIEIDGPAEDQLAIRTMLYYLKRGATDKLPPFGASNAKYRGARFWDAEAWMLPVLAVVDKEKAERATRWRLDNLGGYVPWEAAVGGKDVTPKEFGNALHVAGWVAWWANRAKLLGLATEDDEKKVLEVAFTQYYKAASSTPQPPPHFQRNKEGEFGMEIKGVESPDEGRLRDNDLVTNLLAKRVARLAADHGIADGEDLEWFNSIKIPKAQDGLPATYDNDLLKGYQQTAALLALYPLEEDFDKGVAEKMFDRYADLTSEVGPAMSESIHATIAARLKRRDAYARWRKSWQTYTDDAMMFHERRNKQDAYFMTGAAGCLQTVLYGFAGIHIEKEGISAPASKSLGNGYQVAFRPNLPAEWKSITLRNVFLGPTRATVRITHSGVTIE